MGRALEYGMLGRALLRVMAVVCHCEKVRGRCAECPVADAFDALKRLIGTDAEFEPAEAVAAIFRSAKEE